MSTIHNMHIIDIYIQCTHICIIMMSTIYNMHSIHTHICLLQRQKNLAITFLQHSSSLPPSPDGKESFLEKISHLVITKHDFSLEHSLTISYPVLCPRVLLGPAGQVGEEH